MVIERSKHSFFNEKMPVCALSGAWLSFCLVDESGDGKPYGGLRYEVFDSAGGCYKGRLTERGFAKLEGLCKGPVVLVFDASSETRVGYYSTLQQRKTYPLPITDLQIRAEQTRFSNTNGCPTERHPAGEKADQFYQVEVSDLVRHIAHLPR